MTPCPYRGEILDLQSFFAPETLHDSRNDRYEVRGISDHHGHLGGGHYTAQFKHPLTGEWWNMDDHTASSLPAPSFSSSNYLFYFRRIPPSLAPPSPSPSPSPA
jgi:ubiquitin C-terminal hydrolase